MEKNLSRAAVRKIVDETFWAVHRIAQATRRWDDCIEAARKGEREHLAFGARMLGRRPRRQQPLDTAARYFAVKWFLESADKSAEWAVDARDDARLAYLTRKECARIGGTYGDVDAPSYLACLTMAHFPAFAALDYAQHFAVRE